MKIYIDFSELKRLASIINDKLVVFSLNATPRAYADIELDLDLDIGVEVEVNDVETTGGLLSYKGRQVLLYIKDHTRNYDKALLNGQAGNKYHVAHCRTLESMIDRNRFQRYVATNNISHDFKISSSNYPEDEAEVELWVCQNCLDLLNYKNSRSSSKTRYKNAKDFNLKEFFSTYSSCFKYLPKRTSSDNINYTADWKIISAELRKQKNYTCEKCTVNLSGFKNLCHAHHINGVKSDNELSNLEVLCADCHRKSHNGAMYVSFKNMQTINSLRREQRLLDHCSWDDVFELADPAIHGEMGILRDKGFTAPEVGYDVVDAKTGAVIMQLEVAWPDQKRGIAIESVSIPGWKVSAFGEILKELN